jgi:hypothetical protein
MMKNFFFFVLLLAGTCVYASAQYTFTPLDFPGADNTTARGINNHGDIVGSYRIVPPRHAMTIKDGVYTPLAPDIVLVMKNPCNGEKPEVRSQNHKFEGTRW